MISLQAYKEQTASRRDRNSLHRSVNNTGKRVLCLVLDG